MKVQNMIEQMPDLKNYISIIKTSEPFREHHFFNIETWIGKARWYQDSKNIQFQTRTSSNKDWDRDFVVNIHARSDTNSTGITYMGTPFIGISLPFGKNTRIRYANFSLEGILSKKSVVDITDRHLIIDDIEETMFELMLKHEIPVKNHWYLKSKIEEIQYVLNIIG